MPNTTEGTRSHDTVGIQEVVRAADECFGSEFAVEWLTSPKAILGGDTPLDHTLTPGGGLDVINEISRLSLLY